MEREGCMWRDVFYVKETTKDANTDTLFIHAYLHSARARTHAHSEICDHLVTKYSVFVPKHYIVIDAVGKRRWSPSVAKVSVRL